MDSWATCQHANFHRNVPAENSPLNIYLQNVLKRNEESSHLTSSHTYMFCFCFCLETKHIMCSKRNGQPKPHISHLLLISFLEMEIKISYISQIFSQKKWRTCKRLPSLLRNFGEELSVGRILNISGQVEIWGSCGTTFGDVLVRNLCIFF